MPKVKRGRLDGLWGMTKFTAEELFRWSRTYETRLNSHHLQDKGHPNWLKRRAIKLQKLAEQKQKMRLHKTQQRRQLEREYMRKLASEVLHDLLVKTD